MWIKQENRVSSEESIKGHQEGQISNDAENQAKIFLSPMFQEKKLIIRNVKSDVFSSFDNPQDSNIQYVCTGHLTKFRFWSDFVVLHIGGGSINRIVSAELQKQLMAHHH